MRVAGPRVISTGLAKHLSAAALMLIGTALTTFPALAQAETVDAGAYEAPAGKVLCDIVEGTPKDAPQTYPAGYLDGIEEPIMALFATCDGKGLWLGMANSFQVIDNPALEVSIVELTWLGRKRVLLVSPAADGRLMLEDLSGSLAYKAGRAPTSLIDDLSFDYTGFAETGVIGILGTSLTESRAANEAGDLLKVIVEVPLTDSYSVADHIDSAKALQAILAQAPVGGVQ